MQYSNEWCWLQIVLREVNPDVFLPKISRGVKSSADAAVALRPTINTSKATMLLTTSHKSNLSLFMELDYLNYLSWSELFPQDKLEILKDLGVKALFRFHKLQNSLWVYPVNIIWRCKE